MKRILSVIIILIVFITCKKSNEAKINLLILSDSITSHNKTVAIAFFKTAFITKDVNAAFKTYVADTYIQHNPNVADGKALPIQYLSSWLQENPKSSCEIKRVIGEGDMVVIHSHWKDSPEKRGQAGVDIFKIKKGKIVEHWDVLQDVPEKSANNHTMF